MEYHGSSALLHRRGESTLPCGQLLVVSIVTVQCTMVNVACLDAFANRSICAHPQFEQVLPYMYKQFDEH